MITASLSTGNSQTPPTNNLIKDQHASDSPPPNTIILVPESQQTATNNVYTNVFITTMVKNLPSHTKPSHSSALFLNFPVY